MLLFDFLTYFGLFECLMYVLSLIFFMVLRCNGCFASLAQVTTLKHILI